MNESWLLERSNMSEKRRDNKKRLLWEGEVQEQNGRYKYRYTDSNGKRKSVYSWRLTSTDPFPAGKKPDLSLREKEQIIQKGSIEWCVQ